MKILFTFILILIFACSSAPKMVEKVDDTPLDTMRIVLSGDFMQHMPQVNAARIFDGFNYTAQLRYIAPFWQGADFSIINLETTLSDVGQYTGYPMFRSPVEVAVALSNSGITHCALANNHALDRGRVGVEKTAEFLDSAGLERFGVWLDADSVSRSYVVLEKGALRVAVLNHTYGTNGMPLPRGVSMNMELDTVRMLEDISMARRVDSATHIVAFVHWGDEYVTVPNREQRRLALWLRARGVNTVVGSHPHTAQPIDYENSVVYSLGNFVSNQRKVNTDAGVSVALTVTQGDSIGIEHVSHYCDVSGSGVEKYRVLTLADSLVVENRDARVRMITAIERVEKILRTPVSYD